MKPLAADALTRLGAALPPLPADAELILRPGEPSPTATVRVPGAAPRVFTFAATAADADEAPVCEQLPGDDRGLAGAGLLACDAALAERLQPLVGAIASAQLVAWRPGRRAVVRIVAADGTTHWLKLLDRKNWRRARSAFAAVGTALPPLVLQLPTALLDDVHGYLAADAGGTPLRTLLAGDHELPWTTIARSVLALAYTPVVGELPTFDFERARAASLGALQQGGETTPALLALAAAVQHLPAPAEPHAPGLVHGDLHDKQLFVAGDRTAAIDLEGMARGDARFDVANLVEHVRLRDLQQHGDDRGRAEQLLARCGHAADDRGVRAFRALVRARLCGVYALRPRWHALVDRLAEESRLLIERLRMESPS